MGSTLMHSSANYVVAHQLFIYLNQLRVFLPDFSKFPVGGTYSSYGASPIGSFEMNCISWSARPISPFGVAKVPVELIYISIRAMNKLLFGGIP
ncbi:uncharacterized protein M6B38_176005 [Iris pallida]|uniref:Uncharacterized protein n=1 Tax=Iris pallida TaxID=29817 RepID=A0AAX6EQW0_IRIPA|nr:uncharacterized protein M6B38_176005 [Iris pallida]